MPACRSERGKSPNVKWSFSHAALAAARHESLMGRRTAAGRLQNRPKPITSQSATDRVHFVECVQQSALQANEQLWLDPLRAKRATSYAVLGTAFSRLLRPQYSWYNHKQYAHFSGPTSNPYKQMALCRRGGREGRRWSDLHQLGSPGRERAVFTIRIIRLNIGGISFTRLSIKSMNAFRHGGGPHPLETTTT